MFFLKKIFKLHSLKLIAVTVSACLVITNLSPYAAADSFLALPGTSLVSEWKHIKCSSCGIDTTEHVHTIVKNGSEYRFVKCSDCGLIYMDPQPPREFLSSLYEEKYYRSPVSEMIGYDDYEMERSVRIGKAERYIRYMTQAGINGGSVLDIGAAFGYFLSVAQQAGWKVDGIDVSAYAVEKAEQLCGIKLRQGFFEDVEFDRQYDAITMFDSFEHMADPKAVLTKAHNLLAENGSLVVRIPDLSKEAVFKIDHLYYFSEEVIRDILQECGFLPAKIIYESDAMVVIAHKIADEFHTGYKALGMHRDNADLIIDHIPAHHNRHVVMGILLRVIEKLKTDKKWKFPAHSIQAMLQRLASGPPEQLAMVVGRLSKLLPKLGDIIRLLGDVGIKEKDIDVIINKIILKPDIGERITVLKKLSSALVTLNVDAECLGTINRVIARQPDIKQRASLLISLGKKLQQQSIGGYFIGHILKIAAQKSGEDLSADINRIRTDMPHIASVIEGFKENRINAIWIVELLGELIDKKIDCRDVSDKIGSALASIITLYNTAMECDVKPTWIFNTLVFAPDIREQASLLEDFISALDGEGISSGCIWGMVDSAVRQEDLSGLLARVRKALPRIKYLITRLEQAGINPINMYWILQGIVLNQNIPIAVDKICAKLTDLSIFIELLMINGCNDSNIRLFFMYAARQKYINKMIPRITALGESLAREGLFKTYMEPLRLLVWLESYTDFDNYINKLSATVAAVNDKVQDRELLEGKARKLKNNGLFEQGIVRINVHGKTFGSAFVIGETDDAYYLITNTHIVGENKKVILEKSTWLHEEIGTGSVILTLLQDRGYLQPDLALIAIYKKNCNGEILRPVQMLYAENIIASPDIYQDGIVISGHNGTVSCGNIFLIAGWAYLLGGHAAGGDSGSPFMVGYEEGFAACAVCVAEGPAGIMLTNNIVHEMHKAVDNKSKLFQAVVDDDVLKNGTQQVLSELQYLFVNRLIEQTLTPSSTQRNKILELLSHQRNLASSQ